MKFAGNDEQQARMALEWPRAHPDIIRLLIDFEVWSFKQGMHEPVATEIYRSHERNAATYLALWKDLIRKAKLGDPMTPAEEELAGQLLGLTDEQLRARADSKFSWHICMCAIDLRIHDYTTEQLAQVEQWFERKCAGSMWELPELNHGTAPHRHISRRDFSWRPRSKGHIELV